MRGAGQAVDQFGNSVNRSSQAQEGHRLSLGRVERALASYVGHAVGANSVTEQLSTAFGAFALGGTAVAGVLLGIGAVVAIYEKLTEGTRKAKEESDKFGQSLLDQAKAQFQVSIAGRQEALNQANDRLEAAKRETGAGVFSQMLQGMAPGGQSMGALTTGDAAKRTKAIGDAAIEAQQAVNNLGLAIAHLNGTPVAPAAATSVKELTVKVNELRDAAAKVNAEQDKEGKDFWRSYIESTKAAMSITDQLAERIRSRLPSVLDALEALSQVGQTVPTFTMPKISMDDGLTKEQIKTRDQITGNADKNAVTLRDAIENSALQIGNIVVNALNVGGGGKGSSIGGAIGSTAGFVAGSFLPFPGGSVVGSTIGNVLGSLVGGLFDNSQATRDNTAATNALTSELRNAPSGYDVAYNRSRAATPRGLYDTVAQEALMRARRGGAQLLSVTP